MSKPYILVEPFGKYALLLQQAFDQICDPEDWKGPIHAMVPWDAANVYMQAVQHMTATSCTCELVTRDGIAYALLKSVGYRAGPAGDG